jgi:Leucine-rich repeat (LRR) protein
LLKYTIAEGLVRKLDFSEVNNKIIRWYDREQMQDITEIVGIRRLTNIKKIEFFPIEWALANEINLNCQITLIQTVENFTIAKELLINEANKILDQNFKGSMTKKIDNLESSEIKRKLLNFLSLCYLKKKYPNLSYKLEDGEISELIFEGIKLVSLKPCLRYLTSLKHLNLRKCSLYTIPDYFSEFHQLTSLNLEWNNLKEIPSFLKNMSQIKNLNVNYNRL